MKCKQCGHRYSAEIYQPAPGGSSPPGKFFVLGLIMLCIAGVLFLLDVIVWPWVAVGSAAFSWVVMVSAWSNCRGNGGYAEHHGIDCSKCDTTNPVYLWTF